MCGLVSINVTQSLTGFELSDSQPMPFWATLMTTLVQGAVLNVVLGIYALLVYALQATVAVLRR
jgi:hypothetical protein